jgi:hypothetical protein
VAVATEAKGDRIHIIPIENCGFFCSHTRQTRFDLQLPAQRDEKGIDYLFQLTKMNAHTESQECVWLPVAATTVDGIFCDLRRVNTQT